MGPTPDEAAAALAAVELFIAETTPVVVAEEPKMNPWYRAGLLESVDREPERF